MEGKLMVMIMIVMIIGISTGAWLINNWIRAKHGYPLEDDLGLGLGIEMDDGEGKKAKKKIKRLEAENKELNEKLDEVQDRMIVLEKIVTDRGYSLSEEIEALRDNPLRDVPTQDDSGVPLNIGRKEKA